MSPFSYWSLLVLSLQKMFPDIVIRPHATQVENCFAVGGVGEGRGDPSGTLFRCLRYLGGNLGYWKIDPQKTPRCFGDRKRAWVMPPLLLLAALRPHHAKENAFCALQACYTSNLTQHFPRA